MFFGVLLWAIVTIAIYWTNTYHTGYLPINTNPMFTDNGSQYNVSAILNDKGLLDVEKYLAYSPIYIATSSIIYYIFFFPVYSAATARTLPSASAPSSTVSSATADEMTLKISTAGLCDPTASLQSDGTLFLIQLIAVGLGVAAVVGWPTNTNVGVIFFGIALAVLFTVPTGIIYATTDIEMNFFKGFGYVTVAHALSFANDLKLGHYLKVPPSRQTFCNRPRPRLHRCNELPNHRIPDMCEPTQRNRFTCPNLQSYFTAAVLFGSLGARRVFGAGAQYTALLATFPAGLIFPIIHYYATRHLAPTHWLIKIHPVVILSGAHAWSPYNLGYMWPAVLLGWLSWNFLRKRYLSFWSKYNYVLSAVFSSGIAIAAVMIFFAVIYHGKEIDWIGNFPDKGYGSTACTRLSLGEGEYFGPRAGTFVV
ncbi:OPT oligopeptide transporter protein-domain-containing protein [Aspergillus heterothallicus]